jgi:hypothetical protein
MKASLRDRIGHALDENHILILGSEVLLGFQFEAFFMETFDGLPHHSHRVMLAGLFFQLAAVILLIAPVAYHRIVLSGEDTTDLHTFVTFMTGASLFPLAFGLSMSAFVAAERYTGLSAGIVSGSITLGTSLFFWYGLELIRRWQYNKGKNFMRSQPEQRRTPSLEEKIDRALTETRIVLPGAQALLGFQFIIFLTHAFETLPEWQRTLHAASLACVGISTILLLAPAAYHRIVDEGDDSERLHQFTGRVLIFAIGFLALGLAGDSAVIVAKTTGSPMLALASGALVLLFSLGLWYGFPYFKRRTRGKA